MNWSILLDELVDWFWRVCELSIYKKNNSSEKEFLDYRWKNLGGTMPYTTNLVTLISKADKKKRIK